MRRGRTLTQPGGVLSHRQQGSMLAELLVALLLGSIVMLAGGRMLTALRLEGIKHERRMQREETLVRVLARLGKDLRRAGFCASGCRVSPPTIGRHPGEAAASCLIVYYDLNANGRLEGGESGGEAFGYRLRGGALETLRPARECRGANWEKLTDNRYITVTGFRVDAQAQNYRLWLRVRQTGGGEESSAVRIIRAENL